MRIILLLLSLLMLLSCNSEKPENGSSAQTSTPAVSTYTVTGTLVEIPAANADYVIIRHDEIPGYMEEMKMPFYRSPEADLSGLSEGDAITFTFEDRSGKLVITEISKTDS